jgi:hypothetical protein
MLAAWRYMQIANKTNLSIESGLILFNVDALSRS